MRKIWLIALVFCAFLFPLKAQSLFTSGDTTLTTEEVEDMTGAMITNGTGTVVTYDDENGKVLVSSPSAGGVTNINNGDNLLNVINGSTTASILANTNAFTSAYITNGTLVAADLAANSIDTDKIVNGSVASNDIANNSITSAKINNGAIATADIAANAITSALVLNGTIAATDLADSYQSADADLTAIAGISGVNGDVLTYNSGTWTKLAAGSAGDFLTTNGTDGLAYWSTAGGSSEWTDTGSIIHPSESTVDEVVIGGTNEAGADIFLGVDGAAVFNEQGNNVNFRVESNGDAVAFVVDASTNNVGIGTSIAAKKLHVKAGNENVARFDTSSAGTGLILELYSSSAPMGSVVDIYQTYADDSPSTYWSHGYDSDTGDFIISSASGLDSYKVVIESGGNTSIGEAQPNEKLTVNGNLSLANQSSAPSATEGFGKIFVNGNTLYFIDNGGTQTDLTAGGGASEINDLSDAISDNTSTGSVFLGNSSGSSDDGTNANTGVGSNSLANVTSGTNNVAIGHDSQTNNMTASSNTAVGLDSLRNVTGNSNTAVGANAGKDITSGALNSAFGEGALDTSNTTGSRNTCMGARSCGAISTGSDNVVLGYDSGDNITTGNGNLIIGYQVDPTAATSMSELNIGGLIFGNLANGEISIKRATADPSAELEVNGSLSLDNLAAAPSAVEGFGKIFVNGNALFFIDNGGTQTQIAPDSGTAGNTTTVKDVITSHQTVSASTTYTDSTLTFDLKGNTWYHFTGRFNIKNNNLGNGCKIRLTIDGSTNFDKGNAYVRFFEDGTGISQHDYFQDGFADSSFVLFSNSLSNATYNYVLVDGDINIGSTDRTLKVQFAQTTASGSVQMNNGSNMIFTKVD